jgi:uncharacterized protein (TIGR00369 family)
MKETFGSAKRRFDMTNNNTERLVRPEHMNAAGSLFGGIILAWIDEAAAIAARKLFHTTNFATVAIKGGIEFRRPAHLGDLVLLRSTLVRVGRTSIAFHVEAEVFDSPDPTPVCIVDEIIFVLKDAQGKPHPHGLSPSLIAATP